MEPIDYLRALRARWYVIVVAGLVGVIATWMTTPDRPAPIQRSGIEQYTATHTLIQEEVGSDGRSVDLNRAALLTRTGEVPRRVVHKLGLDVVPAVLAASVDVQTETEVRALRITVTHQDGPTAARLADTFAAETVAYLDERERARQQRLIDVATARAEALQRQSIELQARIPTLREDQRALAQAQYEAVVRQFGVAYEQVQAVASQDPTLSGLVTLEEATPLGVVQGGIRAPATRSGRMMLLVPVAFALGVALVLLLHRVDTRVRTKNDAEAVFALPVVAEVPLLPWRERRRLSALGPDADPPHFAEAFRTLRSSVRFMAPRSLTPDAAAPGVAGIAPSASTATGAEVLLVTSPGVAEGKTTVVCNLAASFARAGHSVLVLDFDLANPDTAGRLGARGGAVRVSPAERGVRAADLARPTAVRGVSVVADWLLEDADEAAELGAALVASARGSADVVIVDTPGLLVASDAVELVSTADAVVVVCRAGVTSTSAARRAAEMLGRFRATALGVVLVGAGSAPRLLPFLERRRMAHHGAGGSPAPTDRPRSAPTAPPEPRPARPEPHVPTRAASTALVWPPLRRSRAVSAGDRRHGPPISPPSRGAAPGASPLPGPLPATGSNPGLVARAGPPPLPPPAEPPAAPVPPPTGRPQPAPPPPPCDPSWSPRCPGARSPRWRWTPSRGSRVPSRWTC